MATTGNMKIIELKKTTPYSLTLVGIQISLIAYLLLSGPVIARNGIHLFLQLLGIGVGLSAVNTMGFHNLRATAEPADTAVLLKGGLYRWIRHPMYSSVFLFCLGLLLAAPVPLRITAFALLSFDLYLKMNHEEKLLNKMFAEYTAYCQKTKRILPCIY